MNVSFPIAAMALAAALSSPASAQPPAQPMLLSKPVPVTRAATAPKPSVSLTTGPEFKRETFVQRFWGDSDQRGEGLSKIDDRSDISVLTLGLHF